MILNRRQFVILGAAVAAGCAAEGGGKRSAATIQPRDVDAGPADGYASDGVYDRFSGEGFFIVRREGRLMALSSICTHRTCRLHTASGQSYVCKCHGSRFDPLGHVLNGPARRDLPIYTTTIDGRGHLVVRVR